MKTNIELSCQIHYSKLKIDEKNQEYFCRHGCSILVRDDIPRFVPIDNNYTSSFGLQWNEYRTTQLDSFTGLSISKDRLTRLLGGTLDILKGKDVLEAGCGAGRFSELLLAEGAHLFAIDLSTAVQANYRNCNKYHNYFVCQADILNLPVKPEQFDIVICIGVIQHTPDPEKTIAALCSHVKPGGLMVIDHYTSGYPVTYTRRWLRTFLIRMPIKFRLHFCKALTTLLWPLHRMFWRLRKLPLISRLRSVFLYLSPIVDYHDAYIQIGPQLLKMWATLDTHDTLTDYYKHLRSAEEIRMHLQLCGMSDIETVYAGNGVEARARKPIREENPGKDIHGPGKEGS
jgi:2-polyprenyl-3-methyl-5-hydroxy-6-metoxy-1,4-benzoquinol methylase